MGGHGTGEALQMFGVTCMADALLAPLKLEL